MPYDPVAAGALTFAAPDAEKYPCLGLAYEVLGGAYGSGGACATNAANEIAVAECLEGRIRFTDIYRLIRQTLDALPVAAPRTLDDYVALDAAARQIARDAIHTLKLNC